MNKITIKNKELQSLKILIQYLFDSECKHYEECDLSDKTNHIYQHVKIVNNLVDSYNN